MPAEKHQIEEIEELKGYKRFVRKEMDNWKVPGLAMAIVRNGKVIFSEGFGYKDRRKKLPVTPDTLFGIASNTKAFTAMCLGMLVDEGKLDWDKPVRDYMPEFGMRDPVADDRITARDLLCHRCGLPRHDRVWYGSSFNRREIVERIKYLEPNRDFRYSYNYQNLMYVAAGYLIEKVSGQTWEEMVRKRIFNPLKMDTSNFTITELKKSEDFSMPYEQIGARVKLIDFYDDEALGPAGTINSSAEEMARWVMLNINKGKCGRKHVVSKKIAVEMQTPHVVVDDPVLYDELFQFTYGLGWNIRAYRGYKLVSHGGNIDGYASLTSFIPGEKTGMVILTNLDASRLPGILTYEAYDRLLGLKRLPWSKRIMKEAMESKRESDSEKRKLLAGASRNTKPTHKLAEYCGDYNNKAYGRLKVLKNGKYLAMNFNSMEMDIMHLEYDTFMLKRRESPYIFLAKFILDSKRNIVEVGINFEDKGKDIIFNRET